MMLHDMTYAAFWPCMAYAMMRRKSDSPRCATESFCLYDDLLLVDCFERSQHKAMHFRALITRIQSQI